MNLNTLYHSIRFHTSEISRLKGEIGYVTRNGFNTTEDSELKAAARKLRKLRAELREHEAKLASYKEQAAALCIKAA